MTIEYFDYIKIVCIVAFILIVLIVLIGFRTTLLKRQLTDLRIRLLSSIAIEPNKKAI